MAVYGVDGDHSAVRGLCCDAMRRNPNRYLSPVMGVTLEDHLASIGVWGMAELQAAADTLNVALDVFSVGGEGQLRRQRVKEKKRRRKNS